MKTKTIEKPYEIRYAYANGKHEPGEVVSRHATRVAADKAQAKHATPSFLYVADRRDEE